MKCCLMGMLQPIFKILFYLSALRSRGTMKFVMIALSFFFHRKFEDTQLTVKCVECRTTGEVIASAMLPDLSDIDITDVGDLFDDSMLGVTLNGVGAVVNLDFAAAASGDFSVPLLKTESPIGIAGPGFQLGVVFTVDLVLKVNGKIETGGGFKVAIPDNSSFMIPFDVSKPNVANFNGTSATLLPITLDLPVDVTAALRLGVEAGVMLPDLEVVELTALAGAFISIPEVVLKGSASLPSNDTCVISADAELNINAGVFVDVGADLGGIQLGDSNPGASTTFLAVSTSTCLKAAGGIANATATTTATTTATATAMGTGVILTTGTGLALGTGIAYVSGSPTPSPSYHWPSSIQPHPTTLAVMCKPAPQKYRLHGDGAGMGRHDTSELWAAVSSAVIAQSQTTRTTYPLISQNPVTPVAAIATTTPTAAGPAFSILTLR